MELQDIAKFLINPFLYLFFGLALLLILRKSNRILMIIITIYFYIICIPLTGILFSNIWKIDDTYDSSINYDAVVVLGGIVDYRWYINERVFKRLLYEPKNYYRFNSAVDRILAGIGFVKSGHARMFLYGNIKQDIYVLDRFESFNAGSLVKEFVLEQGIAEEKIKLYGNNIKRTLDEVNGLKDWIKNNPMEKLLLITSELHMPRASAMFNNKGLSLDIFSVHKTTLKLKWKYFIPSPYGAKYTMECLYELAGFFGYFIRGDI